MSRSYRKAQVYRDYMKTSNHGKIWKRIANKKVRKSYLVAGCYYKKCYCSWNIHDYSWYISNLPKNWKSDKCYRYFMCK